MGAVDNMMDEALAAEAGLVRRYLERHMREAPDGSQMKEDAVKAYAAFASVSITAKAGRDFQAGAAREVGELEARNTLFMQATDRATELWRRAGGDPEILPDTGRLIYWLLGNLASVSRELDKALLVRPAVVRMSEKFEGPTVDPNEEEPEPIPQQTAPARKRVRKPKKD